MNTVGRSYLLITSGPGFSKGPRYFETVVFFFSFLTFYICVITFETLNLTQLFFRVQK